MSDDANLSELLDDDKLPDEYPPERPLGVEDPGVTADHGAIGDSLAERVAREEPDVLHEPSSDDGALGHLVEPDLGMAPDAEADLVASAVDSEVGALADGDLVTGDETLRDVATERVDDRSAEELALHLTEEPPLLEGDSYLDDPIDPTA
ncbi:MAG: hypothetical protein M3503_03355 [Actinomycetota bacterium]|nr:hypothetical protein [Actinomycetota bacterium]